MNIEKEKCKSQPLLGIGTLIMLSKSSAVAVKYASYPSKTTRSECTSKYD